MPGPEGAQQAKDPTAPLGSALARSLAEGARTQEAKRKALKLMRTKGKTMMKLPSVARPFMKTKPVATRVKMNTWRNRRRQGWPETEWGGGIRKGGRCGP